MSTPLNDKDKKFLPVAGLFVEPPPMQRDVTAINKGQAPTLMDFAKNALKLLSGDFGHTNVGKQKERELGPGESRLREYNPSVFEKVVPLSIRQAIQDRPVSPGGEPLMGKALSLGASVVDPSNAELKAAFPFFSKVGKALEGAQKAKMQGQEWSGVLKKFGVAEEELKQTGFGKYLEENAKTSLTKEELVNKYSEDVDRITPNVIEHGENPESLQLKPAKLTQYARDKGHVQMWEGPRDNTGHQTFVYETKDGNFEVQSFLGHYGNDAPVYDNFLDANKEVHRLTGNTLKHPYYNIMPGGENRKELLVQLPNFPATFKGSHWSEPNVMGHVLTDMRKSTDGKNVYGAWEIQSDWAQQGRAKGFAGKLEDMPDVEIPEPTKTYKELKNKPTDISTSMNLADTWNVDYNGGKYTIHKTEKGNFVVEDLTTGVTHHGDRNMRTIDETKNLIKEITRKKSTPDFPYKNTSDWVDVMLGTALEDAIKNRADYFAIPPVEAQTKMHGTQLVKWEPEMSLVDPKRQMGFRVEGTAGEMLISDQQELEKYLIQSTQFGSRKEAKEQAAKIWERMQKNPAGEAKPREEGLKEFYGKIVPGRLQKMLQKLGYKEGLFEFPEIPVNEQTRKLSFTNTKGEVKKFDDHAALDREIGKEIEAINQQFSPILQDVKREINKFNTRDYMTAQETHELNRLVDKKDNLINDRNMLIDQVNNSRRMTMEETPTKKKVPAIRLTPELATLFLQKGIPMLGLSGIGAMAAMRQKQEEQRDPVSKLFQ